VADDLIFVSRGDNDLGFAAEAGSRVRHDQVKRLVEVLKEATSER